jgi:hypothetical protein
VGDGVNEDVWFGRDETDVEDELGLGVVAGKVGGFVEGPEKELVVDRHPRSVDGGEDAHEAFVSEGWSKNGYRSE